MSKRALGAALIMLVSLTGCKVLVSKYWFSKGNQLFKDNKFDKAIGMYNKALDADPEFTLAYFYKGMANYSLYKPGVEDEKNKKRADDAITCLSKVLEKEPDNQDAMLTLADLFDKLGNETEALNLYHKRIADNPQDATAYYKLADYFAKHGKTDEAVKTYQKRIDLDPNNPEGYLYLARFFESGLPEPDFDKSIEQHRKRIPLLTDDQSIKEGYYSIAVTAWAKSFRSPDLTAEDRMSTIKTGYEGVDKALEIDPEYPDALIYKGLLIREEAKMLPEGAAKTELIDKAKALSEQAMAIKKHLKEAEAATSAPPS